MKPHLHICTNPLPATHLSSCVKRSVHCPAQIGFCVPAELWTAVRGHGLLSSWSLAGEVIVSSPPPSSARARWGFPREKWAGRESEGEKTNQQKKTTWNMKGQGKKERVRKNRQKKRQSFELFLEMHDVIQEKKQVILLDSCIHSYRESSTIAMWPTIHQIVE